MGQFKEIASLLEVEHYEGKDSQKSPEDNWKVTFGGIYIGDLHDCDGIGGHIGEFTETSLFDYACTLAKEDLKSRKEGFSNHLEKAASILDIAQTLLGEDERLYTVRCSLQDLIEDEYGPKEYKTYLGNEIVSEMFKTDKDRVGEAITFLSVICNSTLHSTPLNHILKQLEEYYGSME